MEIQFTRDYRFDLWGGERYKATSVVGVALRDNVFQR